MHTADWSDIPELDAANAEAILADAAEALEAGDAPTGRHSALEFGYWAFWDGAPFETPSALAEKPRVASLWTAGYTGAYRAACRDRALPLRPYDVVEGMIVDRGRGRVSRVTRVRPDRTGTVTIKSEAIGPEGRQNFWVKTAGGVFWVNSAPAGTLVLLKRGLLPDEATQAGLETMPDFDKALSTPLLQDHPMPYAAKPEKHDREAAAQADSAAQRDDREKTAMARAPWVSPAPVAEDTWTPRGPGLCHALAEYCDCTGASASDLAHRCQAGMGGATVRQWIGGGLPVKVPVADIAAAMGLTVRTANRLWLRQWVAGAREPYVVPETSPGDVVFRFMLDRGYSFKDMERESGVADSSLRSYISTGARPKADMHDRLSACMGDGWRLPTYGEAPTPPPGTRLMPPAEDRAGRLTAFALNPNGAATGTVHKLTPTRAPAPAKAAPPVAAEVTTEVAPREPVIHDGEVHHAVPAAPERKLSAVERLVLAAEKGLINEVTFSKGSVKLGSITTTAKNAEAAAEKVLAELVKDASAKAAEAQRNLGMLGG